MRCIDADALFREMEKAQWYNNADRDEIAEKLVLNAPTIEPEPKWIPTSIRKPDKAGQYLVTKQQKTKGVRQLATAHYNPALDDWSGNGNFTNVLAWMPLPTIYGGD